MQAVILAAGMGKRLKELTRNNAKCMVEVNGITLIERALRILDKKGLSKIVVVVGFEGQKLTDFINSLHIKTPVIFVDNEIYDKTNNIYSLLLAKDYLVHEDTLLLESDIIFEEGLIDTLLDDPRETLALVDKFASWMDGTCMELDEDDSIRDFIPGKYLRFEEKEHYYKTVNIYKFSKHFSANIYIPFLEAYFKAMGVNEYYESVIRLISMLEKSEIKAKRLNGQTWYEIDDVQDLDIASTLFGDSDEERYRAIASRFGGYWRYPQMLDFCYLVNPYFPPRKMMEEMKSNFDVLATQYPSGMRVNALLAAKNFGVSPEHIVIGNGAAELIKELMKTFSGKLGVIRPTFEEYGNRYSQELVVFTSNKDDFSYTVQDIIGFYEANPVEALIMINPDNPSGNYIPMNEMLELVKWSKERNMKLVIDESFADFADENSELEATFITEQVLEMYDQLFVVKSISKSYGVPGLRLGVLASSNEPVIRQMKKDVTIWNINSFAEFYMQIAEKYKKDYVKALAKIREAREDFIEKLNACDNIRAFPSQANYVLCELQNGLMSKELAAQMLARNILIKDITAKADNGKQYIRLAVRTKEENDRLIEILLNNRGVD